MHALPIRDRGAELLPLGALRGEQVVEDVVAEDGSHEIRTLKGVDSLTQRPGKPCDAQLRSLALAATIAAGLKGIEEGLPMPEEPNFSLANLSEKEAAKKGIVRLPKTLGEAIDAFAGSELMRETLGDHIFDYLLNEKTREWRAFCTAVTDWERVHYYGGV